MDVEGYKHSRKKSPGEQMSGEQMESRIIIEGCRFQSRGGRYLGIFEYQKMDHVHSVPFYV